MPARKERQIPQIGTVYQKIYKGKMHTLRVVKGTKKAKVAYELDGTTTFLTPTAAAVHITESSINGWKFWKMDKG